MPGALFGGQGCPRGHACSCAKSTGGSLCVKVPPSRPHAVHLCVWVVQTQRHRDGGQPVAAGTASRREEGDSRHVASHGQRCAANTHTQPECGVGTVCVWGHNVLINSGGSPWACCTPRGWRALTLPTCLRHGPTQLSSRPGPPRWAGGSSRTHVAPSSTAFVTPICTHLPPANPDLPRPKCPCQPPESGPHPAHCPQGHQ